MSEIITALDEHNKAVVEMTKAFERLIISQRELVSKIIKEKHEK